MSITKLDEYNLGPSAPKLSGIECDAVQTLLSLRTSLQDPEYLSHTTERRNVKTRSPIPKISIRKIYKPEAKSKWIFSNVKTHGHSLAETSNKKEFKIKINLKDIDGSKVNIPELNIKGSIGRTKEMPELTPFSRVAMKHNLPAGSQPVAKTENLMTVKPAKPNSVKYQTINIETTDKTMNVTPSKLNSVKYKTKDIEITDNSMTVTPPKPNSVKYKTKDIEATGNSMTVTPPKPNSVKYKTKDIEITDNSMTVTPPKPNSVKYKTKDIEITDNSMTVTPPKPNSVKYKTKDIEITDNSMTVTPPKPNSVKYQTIDIEATENSMTVTPPKINSVKYKTKDIEITDNSMTVTPPKPNSVKYKTKDIEITDNSMTVTPPKPNSVKYKTKDIEITDNSMTVTPPKPNSVKYQTIDIEATENSMTVTPPKINSVKYKTKDIEITDNSMTITPPKPNSVKYKTKDNETTENSMTVIPAKPNSVKYKTIDIDETTENSMTVTPPKPNSVEYKTIDIGTTENSKTITPAKPTSIKYKTIEIGTQTDTIIIINEEDLEILQFLNEHGINKLDLCRLLESIEEDVNNNDTETPPEFVDKDDEVSIEIKKNVGETPSVTNENNEGARVDSKVDEEVTLVIAKAQNDPKPDDNMGTKTGNVDNGVSSDELIINKVVSPEVIMIDDENDDDAVITAYDDIISNIINCSKENKAVINLVFKFIEAVNDDKLKVAETQENTFLNLAKELTQVLAKLLKDEILHKRKVDSDKNNCENQPAVKRAKGNNMVSSGDSNTIIAPNQNISESSKSHAATPRNDTSTSSGIFYEEVNNYSDRTRGDNMNALNMPRNTQLQNPLLTTNSHQQNINISRLGVLTAAMACRDVPHNSAVTPNEQASTSAMSHGIPPPIVTGDGQQYNNMMVFSDNAHGDRSLISGNDANGKQYNYMMNHQLQMRPESNNQQIRFETHNALGQFRFGSNVPQQYPLMYQQYYMPDEHVRGVALPVVRRYPSPKNAITMNTMEQIQDNFPLATQHPLTPDASAFKKPQQYLSKPYYHQNQVPNVQTYQNRYQEKLAKQRKKAMDKQKAEWESQFRDHPNSAHGNIAREMKRHNSTS